MIQYWLLRFFAVSRLVPLRVAYWCAVAVARFAWIVLPAQREAAIENLSQALGNRALGKAAARRSFANYGRYLIDFIRAPKIKPEDVASKVRFDRWDLIDEAFAPGKGVIFALMHVGNWDIGGPFLAGHGYNVNVVADTFEHDRLNEVVVQARTVRGMNVIPADRAATGIVRALRRNEILGILMDTPMTEGGVMVEFFGRPAMFPAGVAWLALRTGARVLPTAMVRLRETGDVVRPLIDFDVKIERSGDMDRDIRELTRRILQAHERFIRAYPDQWYIFRPLWPPREPSHAHQPAPSHA